MFLMHITEGALDVVYHYNDYNRPPNSLIFSWEPFETNIDFGFLRNWVLWGLILP